MTDQRYTITSDPTDEVELLLTRFERDRTGGPVDLQDYVPPQDDPAYDAVVTELARIDLEHAFNQGIQPDADRYVQLFPQVFDDTHFRTQLAFEEFRLRRRGGEDVTADQVGQKFDVDGSHWPAMKLGADKPEGGSTRRRFTESDLATPVVHYPAAGETFAGYPLVSRIGEGAFSRVFLARQPDLASRLVVLKVTPLCTDESDRLAALQHSSIIPVYSVHNQGDLSCICMPFLGATTLADLSAHGRRWASLDGPAEELISTIVDRRSSTMRTVVADHAEPTPGGDGPAAAGEASHVDTLGNGLVALSQYSRLGYVDALLKLVIGSVEGLAHAHRRGIIHRDLKPANILVADDGTPVLLDFNLAVSTQDAKTRIVGGTLPYMSPQQLQSLQSGDVADARDDVFSMGVVLYELLSGQLPFACPHSGEAFELSNVIADRRRPPGSVRSLNAGVSPGLESIINRCIAPASEHRYQDAGELLEDLNRHRQNLPLKFAPDRAIGERLSKWARRHPRMSSASTVAFLAAAVLVICTAMIWQRGEKIARLRVAAHYQEFQDALPEAIAELSTPGREPELLQAGLKTSAQLMQRWGVGSDRWAQAAGVHRLPPKSLSTLTHQLATLAYLMSKAEHHLDLQLKEATSSDQAGYWSNLARELDPAFSSLAELQEQQIAQSRAAFATTPVNWISWPRIPIWTFVRWPRQNLGTPNCGGN